MIESPKVFFLLFFVSAAITFAPGPSLDAASQKESVEAAIVAKTDQFFDEIVQIRRDIHRHPEVSGSEIRTAGVVAKNLEAYGLEVRTGVGGHGVVGILRCATDGPVVAYRADMDALPQDIAEEMDFKSVTPGVSHGCGHDVHTAVGLGAARVLSSLRSELPGTVVFIFQPAEETIEGAKRMIEDGALANPAPEAIFAVHVSPGEAGTVTTNPGVGLPGVRRFSARLRSKVDVDSFAQVVVDSVRAIATVHYPEDLSGWLDLLGEVLVEGSILSSFVLAMAWVESRPSQNERVVAGFFKASGEAEYRGAEERLKRVLSGLEKRGAACEYESQKVLPDMVCDERLAVWAIGPIESVCGPQSVARAYTSVPFFGEDFAYFLERVPGAMFFLGGSNEKNGTVAMPHNPAFHVDENAIKTGVKAMSNVLARYLTDPPPPRSR